ncbi:MAG: hypothetical protein R3E39_04580 [Anaerolineae bacterium]
MNAYDFSINYLAGLMLLRGQDPYTNPLYRYPFPFTYFWGLLALPGENAMSLMFVLWGVVNVALLIYAFRKDFWKWVFFFPFLHELSAGQVEMMFWSAERLIKPGWRGAVWGAFLTLKPQSALVLLPWHLVNWLRHDRSTFAKWILSTVLLWGIPLLWRSDWIRTWLSLRGEDANIVYSASVSTGIFSVLRITGQNLEQPYDSSLLLIVAVLAVIAVLIYVIGQFSSKREIGKACAMLVSPLGLLYTQMALMGTAPAWLLVPVNLISIGVALSIGNFIPCIALPLSVIAWHLWKNHLKHN